MENVLVTAAPALPARRPHALKRLYHWVLHWADTPYGTPALFVISFVESSFFPIPPDVLQIALSIAKPARAYFYAGVSALASVLGAVLGWIIGHLLWVLVSSFFFTYVPGFTRENFDHVQVLYQTNAFLAIFTAAFTPVPFKVFTIAAGVFDISLATLLAASVAGRCGRFFSVATCIFFFGPGVKALIERYFEVATLALVALGVLGFLAIRYMVP